MFDVTHEHKLYLRLPEYLHQEQAITKLKHSCLRYAFAHCERANSLTVYFVPEAETRAEAFAEAARYALALFTGGQYGNVYAFGALLESNEPAHIEQALARASTGVLLLWQAFLFEDLRHDTYLGAVSLHPDVPEDDQQSVAGIVADIARQLKR